MDRNLVLNKKNTLLIGFAFFAILMLWQVYNHFCPLILNYLLRQNSAFAGDENKLFYVIGIIMALDNLVALIIMPIFSYLSDRTKTKIGKRMPYILIGMLASMLIFPFIAVAFIYESLIGVILVMGLILIVMQGYRSPAVALMPDITPKPLRSSANGLINLVGYAGAILAGVLGMVFKIQKDQTSFAEAKNIIIWPFIITSLIMFIILIILAIKIKENELLETMKDDLDYGEKFSESIEEVKEDQPLGKKDVVNLITMLVAIFFWFMAFNAIESFNSLFALEILGESNVASTSAIILTLSSIGTFALFAKLSNMLGRKAVIMIGLGCLLVSLVSITIAVNTINIDESKGLLIGLIYFFTVVLGVGWALVNINSFPMVVEMANRKNIGKFTSYYYCGSMFAQTITPILVGVIMAFNFTGLKLLYTYSAVCMFIAFVVFYFVKENKKVRNSLTSLHKVKGLEKFSGND